MNLDLRCGDSYELIKTIPSKSIDCIITDPPYEINAGGGCGAFGIEHRNYHNEVSKNENINCGITNQILEEFVRVMKKINIYIWCNKNQIRQYLDFFGDLGADMDLLTWHKSNPIPTCSNKYLSDTEYCLFFRRGGVPLYGSYETKHKYWITPTNKEDKDEWGHATIKPLEIIEDLIENSTKVGDTILDPFMGSGTTGVACRNLGRNFVGMEIEQKYFETAKRRVATEPNQLNLF